MSESFYQKCVDAGVYIANHYSDLYIPVNDITRKLLRESGITYQTTFKNQLNGQLWYDIPFAYEPFWKNGQG